MDTAQSQQQLWQTSEDEVTRRVLEHQAAVDRIRHGSKRRALRAGAAARSAQLDFLAIGDSWFEYPLSDDGLPVPFWNAAVVGSNQLQSMGSPPPLINSIALHGQPMRLELRLTFPSRAAHLGKLTLCRSSGALTGAG